MRMDLDHQAVRADGDRRARERQDLLPLAGAVGRIHEDRQVRDALDIRNGGEIERVARVVGEGPHAALAEDHFVVALREEVFGREEELLERGRHAALQEDGLARLAELLQQREVLHVARADLQAVGVLRDELDGLRVQDFGDDREAGLLPHAGEDFQARLAEALEGIGGRPRLERAAPVERRARLADRVADLDRLGQRLDRAGAGDDHDRGSAHGHAPDRDDRVLALGLPGDQLVGRRDRDDLGDARQVLEGARLDRTAVAGDADRRALRSRDGVGREPQALDGFDDAPDVLRGGRRIHDDEHRVLSCEADTAVSNHAVPKRPARPLTKIRRCSLRKRRLLIAFAAIALSASAAFAYNVKLKDGSIIFARTKYEVKGTKAIIVLQNGTVTQIDLATIDVPGTEQYNKDNPG